MVKRGVCINVSEKFYRKIENARDRFQRKHGLKRLSQRAFTELMSREKFPRIRLGTR